MCRMCWVGFWRYQLHILGITWLVNLFVCCFFLGWGNEKAEASGEVTLPLADSASLGAGAGKEAEAIN